MRDLQPVNVIIGKDEFLIQRHRRALTARAGATDVRDVRAGDVTPSELLELLTPSLFDDERVVVVHDLAEAGKEPAALVLEAARNPAPGTTLILEHAGDGRTKSMVAELRKLGAEFRADPIPPWELAGFVAQEFRSLGVRVSDAVTQALVESVGSDLRELSSAVSQLVADNDGEVDLEAVRRYYTGTAEVSSFTVADRIIEGNVPAALAAVRRALQLGVAPMALSVVISRKLADLAKIHGAGGTVSPAEVGMAPRQISAMRSRARSWTPQAVTQAVQLAALMEAGIKGGADDPEAVVELTVAQLAQLGRRTGRR